MITPGKTLTKTQINAICGKLKRDFDPTSYVKPEVPYSDRKEANIKHVNRLISASNLPPSLKKALQQERSSYWMVGDDLTDKDRKVLKFPFPLKRPEGPSEQEVTSKHDKLVEDFKFELTMSDQSGYKKLMAEFQANVKKAFTQPKPKSKK